MDFETKRFETLRQVRKKAALEIPLQRTIRRRYAQILDLFDFSYPATGDAPNIIEVRDEVVTDLTEHYATVRVAFEQEVPQALGVELPPAHQTLALLAFTTWVAARAPFNAARIVATARNRITGQIRAATREIETQNNGQPANRTEALSQAKRSAAPMLRRHAKVAATLETQASAEATKSHVAEALAGRVPRFVSDTPGFSAAALPTVAVATKTWFTELDSRVRDRHAATEGQTREVSELFNVGGQAMLFPADTSHGADLANVINCRCSALYDRDGGS